MPRIRSIHPGLFTDEAFMRLTVEAPLACVLLPGLWTEADDNGIFPWKPLTLAARLLPQAQAEIERLLGLLLRLGFMRRFEVDGRQYAALKSFRIYQKPERPKPVHPLPDELRAYVGLEERSKPGRNPNPPSFSDGETGGDAAPPSAPPERDPPAEAKGRAGQPIDIPQFTDHSVIDHRMVGDRSPLERRGEERKEIRRAPPYDAGASPDCPPLEPPRLELSTPRRALFREGLEILCRLTGRPPASSRAQLGRWLKLAHDDAAAVLDALRAADDASVVGGLANPMAWLQRAVEARAPGAGIGAVLRRFDLPDLPVPDENEVAPLPPLLAGPLDPMELN